MLVAMLEDDFLSRDNWHMIINSKDSFLCGRSRNFLKLPGQSLLLLVAKVQDIGVDQLPYPFTVFKAPSLISWQW